MTALRRALAWLAVAGSLLLPATAFSQAAPISRYARWSGHYDYVATGGSLRSSASDVCALNSSSSGTLTVPTGATVRAAYLYWGGSGTTIDSSVRLNNTTITAQRTFTETFQTFSFFGGFADVTARVTGSGTFTFSNLSVTSSGSYCSSAAVFAGWSLIVIYERAAEPLRAINVFDGLQAFYGGAINLTPDGYRIRPSGNDGKMTIVTWEGDPGNSGSNGGFSEGLRFNGTVLDDGLVPAGSSPTLQQFDGTINTAGVSNSFGVDIDTYNLTPFLAPGATSATTTYSSGLDLVLLTAQIVSVTSDPIVDLSLTKTHTGNFAAGQNGSFTLTVANATGREREDNVIQVVDTLPAGLTYVSATGTGWTCGASGQTVTCTRPPPLAAGTTAPPITLTVAVAAGAAPGVTNTATVTSASFDITAANNTATDPVVVTAPALSATKVSEVLSDPVNGTSLPKRIPGAVLRYTLTVANQGALAADSGSVVVTDALPAGLALYVGGAAPGPVEFINGTPSSGLTLNVATQVSYTNRPGGAAPFDYRPVPDVQGFDPAVTGIRIAPSGAFAPAGVTGTPSFQLRLRVRVQ